MQPTGQLIHRQVAQSGSSDRLQEDPRGASLLEDPYLSATPYSSNRDPQYATDPFTGQTASYSTVQSTGHIAGHSIGYTSGYGAGNTPLDPALQHVPADYYISSGGGIPGASTSVQHPYSHSPPLLRAGRGQARAGRSPSSWHTGATPSQWAPGSSPLQGYGSAPAPTEAGSPGGVPGAYPPPLAAAQQRSSPPPHDLAQRRSLSSPHSSPSRPSPTPSSHTNAAASPPKVRHAQGSRWGDSLRALFGSSGSFQSNIAVAAGILLLLNLSTILLFFQVRDLSLLGTRRFADSCALRTCESCCNPGVHVS